MKTKVHSIVYSLTIIMVAVLACGYYWMTLLEKQRLELDEARHFGELRVQQINEAVDQQLDATIRGVDTALKQLRYVYLHDRSNFNRTANEIVANYPKGMIKFIIVIDDKGYLRYSSNDAVEGKTGPIYFGDREHFRVHAESSEDNLFISKPIIGRIAGVNLIQFTRPIYVGKRFAGVIGIPLRPEYISDSLWSLHINQNDLISIVREDGSIIARSRKLQEGLKLRTPADRPFMHSHAGEHGIFRSTSVTDKVPLLFSWRHLDNYPIIAVAAVDELAELRNINSNQSYVKNYTLLAIGAILAFALWTASLTYRMNQKNQRIESENERNLALLRNASDGIHILDRNGNLIEASNSFCLMLGYEREEIIGKNVALWDAGFTSIEDLKAIVKEQFANANRSLFETLHRRKDGKIFEVEVSGMALKLGERQVLFNSSRDISARRRAEEALRISASVFENTQEAISITDAENNIVEVNPSFVRITGYGREELLGKNPKILSSGRHDKAFYDAMWSELRQHKSWRGEIWNRRKSGEVYAEMLSINAICNNEDQVVRYVAVFSDITNIKKYEDELSRIAHFDALTKIPNRVLLADRMKQAIAQTSREKKMLAVCYLDLDGFKTVNDTIGHEAGDEVLVEVAKRIGDTIRGGDTVARLGGDEFVVLLLGLEKGEECVSTLDRLLKAIVQPIVIGAKTNTVSASIGVSIYPQDNENPDTLLRHADQAMYIAKQAGKSRFHIYDPAMDKRAREQNNILNSIRSGLKNNEFYLNYQPKINLQTKALVGVEALIRWRHPERGVIPPSEFLYLVDNTDLDIEIGEWVIATALAQMHLWRNAGLDIEVSINISGFHLESANFTHYLEQQSTLYAGLSADKLKIEILETVALKDVSIVREVIETCRKFGVGFALDDFGTGYSSLTYLRRLPVETLKIDQSFVRDMLEDKGDLAIVQGVIALAGAFERETVAEGIETAAQYKALLAMGCEVGQGYFMARPMPAEDFFHWKPDFQL